MWRKIAIQGLCILTLAATPPLPQSQTATVAGRVFDSSTSAPIAGASAQLQLQQDDVRPLVQETNAKGEFAFTNVPPGPYVLRVLKPKYLPSTFGQVQSGPGPSLRVSVTPGQRFNDIQLWMTPTAVITGLLADERGEAARAVVRLWRYGWTGGERVMLEVGVQPTDDRGMFRFWDLRPGEYLVAGQPLTDGDTGTAAQVFYPGTPHVGSAVPVRVTAGEERAGVNFQVRPMALYRLAGRVTGGDGRAFDSVRMALTDSSGVPLARDRFSSVFNQSARTFSFSNVPPGNYEVFVSARGSADSNEPALWGKASVSLTNGDQTDIAIGLEPGRTLTGHVVGATSAASGVTVQLKAIDPGRRPLVLLSIGRVGADGVFQVTGVMPGNYLVSVGGLPAGTSVSTVKIGGRDVTDLPIGVGMSDLESVEIAVVNRRTTVSGRLSDTSGRAINDCILLVFPVEERYWVPESPRIRTARPGSDGGYVFQDLAPGNYRVIGLRPSEPDEWYSPAFLKKLAVSAATLVVTEGATTTFDLQIAK